MSDVARLAARRLAAQRRNARRLADAEEEEEEARGGGDGSSVSNLRLVGTVYDADDARTGASAAAVAARQTQSAHDQRRAINARIYGRLNVVEDEKGFAPKAFVSSRSARTGAAAAAAAAATTAAATSAAGGAGAGGGAASESTGGRYPTQRVQDFMDEEDLAESGAAGSDAVHSGLAARASFGPTGSASSAAAVTPAAGELVAPASSHSIALKLLQAMGWRAGHKGTGARSKKKAKTYGAALPPTMRMDSSADAPAQDEDADVSEVSDAVAFARLMEGADGAGGEGADVSVYSSRQKNDTYGVGFVPYSQLSQAARARHDSAYAPLTFVRTKHASPDASVLSQPREYRVDVPADFDGRHQFPLHDEASAAAVPVRGPSVVRAWQGKMDAARRGQLLGERSSEPMAEAPQQQQQQLPRTLTSLPLPPPPPPGAFAAAATAAPAAAPVAAPPTTVASASGMSALDLQRQRRLEAIALAEQGGGGRHPPNAPFSASSFAPPAAHAAAPGPPRIDIQAAIAAATAKAAAMLAEKEREQRKNDRRAKWGPLPPEAVQAAAASSSSFPLAAAFLTANFGAPAVEAPPTAHASLPLPPMPPSAHAPGSATVPSSAPAAAAAAAAAPAPSLALAFPNFVVAGQIDASGASSAASTDTTAASSTSDNTGMMSNFAPASSSSASSAAASSSSAAPAIPSGPFAEYFAAAKMKMFGKLTRRIEDWTPHSLVYKRLGVPVPAHVRNNAAAQQRAKAAARGGAGGGAASTGVAVPGFPSFVQASTPFGSVADPAAAAAAAVPAGGAAAGAESLAAAMADMARDEEAAIQAQLARDDEELYGSNENNMAGATGAGAMGGDGGGGGGWIDVTRAPGQGEPATGAAAAPDSKPSLDLFKAIFEASSDEEDEEHRPLRHKQPARRFEPLSVPLVQPEPTFMQPPPQVVRSAGPAASSSPPFATVGAVAVAPPSSSGFVHPDRLRMVPSPSTGGSSAPAPAAAAARAAASSAPARHALPPAHREVISLDDSDEDMANDGDVHITGFGAGPQRSQPHRNQTEEKKFAPSSFLHSKNSLQFVPASGKPPAPTGRSTATTAASAARGHRFGMSGPPDDDEDDDGYTPAGFATLGRALQPLGGSGGAGSGSGGLDQLHGFDRPQRFVPPPVQPPRAPVQLPPAVPAAWPFASPLAHAHAQEGSVSRPAFAAGSAPPARAPAPPAPAPSAAAGSSASVPASSPSDASSALLSQLLDLQRAHKASKKHKKHRDKERKEKKHKRSSGDKERKEKKHKRERKRSSRSRRRRDSDSSGSSGSSSDSDTSVKR